MKGVVKKFDDCRALDGFNLHVPRGCVYGLVGPNGAGKSTAINHLCGAYRQDAGTVTLEGQPIFNNATAKSRIATIPSDVYYYAQASALDLAKIYQGCYSSFDMARFEKLQGVFNIDPKRLVRRLSKGMKKQVAFWLALSLSPDVLLLDEPLDGLDPVMRRQVWTLVAEEVRQRGMTVVASSHNLRELQDICNYVGIVDKGRMVSERSLNSLQDNMVKVQLAFGAPTMLPAGLQVLSRVDCGHLCTLVIRGNQQDVCARLQALGPLFLDILPLSMEEVFVYEMGGAGYEAKSLAL